MTGKKSKNSASPSVKLKKETLKKLAGNKTAVQKAKARAEAKAKSKSTTSKSKSAPRAVDKGGRLSARGSEGYKPTKTNIGPNMAKVNKPDTPRAKKVDLKKRGPSGPTMTSMKAPSTGPKPRNKDPKVNLKKRGPSRPSIMGFRKGGSIDGLSLIHI